VLAAARPDARLEIIEEAGHVVNLARPERFNAVLRAFLASAPR
jgi:pimeloyl-ACP methyl ester carboxylesterase